MSEITKQFIKWATGNSNLERICFKRSFQNENEFSCEREAAYEVQMNCFRKKIGCNVSGKEYPFSEDDLDNIEFVEFVRETRKGNMP